MYKNKCVYAVGWLGGVVGRCGVVLCGVLLFLKLEIGKIQGFLSVNL